MSDTRSRITTLPWFEGYAHRTVVGCIYTTDGARGGAAFSSDGDRGRVGATREFMLNAVNSHADLIAACEHALDFVPLRERAILLAALAKAKGLT